MTRPSEEHITEAVAELMEMNGAGGRGSGWELIDTLRHAKETEKILLGLLRKTRRAELMPTRAELKTRVERIAQRIDEGDEMSEIASALEEATGIADEIADSDEEEP